MNKIDLLKEFKDMLNHNLLCYSSNGLMNKPSKKFVNEWELAQEKIGLLEEIMEDVKKHRKEDIWYVVKNDGYDVYRSFSTLNDAIAYAEKKKREYMRKYDNSRIWVETSEEEPEEIYEARGYENEETEEFE